jgi:general secretion pathway protein E
MVEASAEGLASVLSKLGLVPERDIAVGLAAMLDLPLTDAADYPDLPVHEPGLSVNFLTASRLVPLDESEHVLTVAMADPLDGYAIQALGLFTGKTIEVRVGVPADIEAAIERLYGEQASSADPMDGADDQGEAALLDDIEHLRDLASEAPVVRIVNRIIADAVEQQASDIHVEPFENKLRVRFRIDGMLRDAETLARTLHPAIISRLKIMAGLNIAERRLPQDGRIKLAVRGRDIDLRMATMPIMHGEAIVLRILDRDSVELDFDRLGFGAPSLGTLRTALARPNGIILVTGPTGSGKTTTLYTSLTELNTAERKVLTVEDPIEYQLEGINQVQIKPQIELSFASVLRSMLRHDPDIIMVGEIRDLETAEIAIQAALTGHLVLSTLHTNNAAGTLARLLDMGVEAFLIASTLNAVVAQRLVRKLCPSCRERYEPLDETRREFGAALDPPATLWRAGGCDHCRGSGYAGRIGINEILVLSDPIREALLRREDAATLQRLAVEAGMRPMLADGIEKAKDGVTTIEEVLRVTREVA